MIKKAIYIIGIILLLSWKLSTGQNLFVVVPNMTEVEPQKSNFNGTWGLTSYFDSIVVHKELARFRLQTPSWFAILIEINNDTLKSFGSIEWNQQVMNSSKDTLALMTCEITGDRWLLLAHNQELKLVQYQHSREIDPTVYIYRKREDLNYFTKKNKDSFVIGNNVTQYFNKELFSGRYIDQANNQEVLFGENGALAGISGFDSYEVENYFGTLHMFNNLDVIRFSNSKTNEYKQYNWVFSNNELILTELIRDIETDEHGETYESDKFILGTEIIKLKK